MLKGKNEFKKYFVKNQLRFTMHQGSDISEVVTGIDKDTNLGYRFNDFSDITLHVSEANTSRPYFSKSLEYDNALITNLLFELKEDELLRRNIPGYEIIDPPPYFPFYVSAVKNGVKVVLFDGLIYFNRYTSMQFL